MGNWYYFSIPIRSENVVAASRKIIVWEMTVKWTL